MRSVFIEESNSEKKAYSSLLIEPKMLGVLNTDLSVKIIQELAKNPACALDLARSLEQHEQKVYYHLRKLEKAGLVKFVKSEKRFGMIAKIYEVVSPVLSVKLYDDAQPLKKEIPENLQAVKFLSPFIMNGSFNATVVLGDTYSHGKFDMYSTEGVHAFDLAFLFGHYCMKTAFPHYKFDTEVFPEDLKNNLILVGHPQTNTILQKINASLPLFFNENDDWAIENKAGLKIRDPRAGIIIKMDNPFEEGKKMLILAGRTRGTQTAILACTKFLNRLMEKVADQENFQVIVQGYDSDGDKVIDEMKFVE